MVNAVPWRYKKDKIIKAVTLVVFQENNILLLFILFVAQSLFIFPKLYSKVYSYF